jgi:DNA-binding Lrp family transcriptional regulator
MRRTLPTPGKVCNSTTKRWAICTEEDQEMDEIDGRMIDLFAREPRLGVLEASRRLGIARGTVQARLDKLAASGVITGWGPDLSPEAIGYPVTAFLTLEIRQGSGHDAVAAHLSGIPEVIEAYTITGVGDMWARVVARSNADLQRVIDLVLTEPGIDRSTTVIALATQIPHRVVPLVAAAAKGEVEGDVSRRRA